MKGPSCRSKGVVLLKQVMVNHEGRSPSIFKAHEITRNNQMFSVSSFLLIISVKGGKKKKTLFRCSKRHFYGTIWVSVQALHLS